MHTVVPPCFQSCRQCWAPSLSTFLSQPLSPAPLCFPWGGVAHGWWQSCLFMLLSRLYLGSLTTLFPGHSHNSHRYFIFLRFLSSLAWQGCWSPRSPLSSCPCISTVWSLGSAGFRLLFGLQGFLSVSASFPPPSLPSLSSDVFCGMCTFIFFWFALSSLERENERLS